MRDAIIGVLLLRDGRPTKGIWRKTVKVGSSFSEVEAWAEAVVAAAGARLGRVPACI